MSESESFNDELFANRACMICVTVLFIKMFHSAISGAQARAKSGKTNNPEDIGVLPNPTNKEALLEKQAPEQMGEEEARWKRIQANDWENIPMFCVIMLMALQTHANHRATGIMTIAFTFCRVMHTLCYAKQIQPWRSIFWVLGLLLTLAVAANGIAGSFMTGHPPTPHA